MKRANLVSYFVKEISKLFDVGEVGLYELVWTLHSLHGTQEESELRRRPGIALNG